MFAGTLKRFSDRRTWLIVAALAVAMGVVGVSAGRSWAQRRVPTPVGARWCGLSDTGGAVRFELTPDKMYVQNIEIQTNRGLLSTVEGYRMDRQQIVDGQFLFRRDERSRECKPSSPQPPGRMPCRVAPCNPEPPCTVAPCSPVDCKFIETNVLTIRGIFTAEDSLHGTYTGILTQNDQDRIRREVPLKPYRVAGSYIAWPEELSPCP